MSQKSWKIRQALRDDATNLKQCMERAYASYIERFQGKRLPPMDVDYEEEIVSFPVWVAEYDNEIVGGIIVMVEDGFMTIANVAVRPDFQGHGVGRGLMDFVELEAVRRGFVEIRLATHVLLTENVSYYRHLGWSEISRDDIRVYMKKSIGV